MTNISIEKKEMKTKRATTPIAPPEHFTTPQRYDSGYEKAADSQEEDTVKRKMSRPSRERSFFAMVAVDNDDQSYLVEFKKRKDVRQYFIDNPDHSLISDFLIWGYKHQVKRIQTVKF